MVVLVKPSPQLGNKAMDGNHHKVEANVLLLGAENVGKSGEHKTELGCLHTDTSVMFIWSVLLSLRIFMYYNYSFAALTVRFLTRRFIGEYGDIGTWNKIYYNIIDNEQINYVVYEIAVFHFTMLSFRINIQSYWQNRWARDILKYLGLSVSTGMIYFVWDCCVWMHKMHCWEYIKVSNCVFLIYYQRISQQ